MTSRKVIVETHLGADALRLVHMTGVEELGRPFLFELELLAHEVTPALTDVLGRPMVVHLDLPDQRSRYFHGHVTELSVTERTDRGLIYSAKVRPWLWFLGRTSNCRIFQSKTVPEILKQVFHDHGFSDFEDALNGSYRSWDYLVQYRETDLSFVTRLMEREGIYYYFKHTHSTHTLVLSDSLGGHQTSPGYEELPYYPPHAVQRRAQEHWSAWRANQQVQPGTYVLDDYDFKRPRASLRVQLESPRTHPHAGFQMYDYPGEYAETREGEAYAKVRLQELQAQFERMHGRGDVRGVGPGMLFTLREHPLEAFNQEYLVTESRYELSAGAYESSSDLGAGPVFQCSIEAIRSSTPFRLPRVTPRPVIAGTQTARVVGKGGEEIWTDEYGRVKVQFPWDREGASDERSSCWIRVSQTWAGAGWGAMHVPRIGQEVLVSFLDGDPDRPLVTGRVYNGNAKPPFELPASGMVSGIKSESTPGGGGYNQISLDDTKGSEKIVVHAQRDMESTIEHDQTYTVHNNRAVRVDADDIESVGGSQGVEIGVDQGTTVGANQQLEVGANQAITVGSSRTLKVGASQSVFVAKNDSEIVGVEKKLTVGGQYRVAVGGFKAEKVGFAKTVEVGSDSSEKVGGKKSVIVEKAFDACAREDFRISSGKKMILTALDDLSVQGKTKGVIDLADELTIKVGGASITLKKNGDVTIKGKKITIDASGDVVMKGSKIAHN